MAPAKLSTFKQVLSRYCTSASYTSYSAAPSVAKGIAKVKGLGYTKSKHT